MTTSRLTVAERRRSTSNASESFSRTSSGATSRVGVPTNGSSKTLVGTRWPSSSCSRFFDRYALDVPDQLVSALRTLADAHHYFVQLGIATDDAQRDPRPRAEVARIPTLQMPTQRDFDYLLELHASGEHLVRYRLRGVTPSPDSFHRLLWEGVTAQFVVRSETGSPVGLVSCFGADFRNRHAHIGVLGDPAWHNSGLLIAGAWRFIGYLFSEFDLRKLYAEVLESNFEHLATGAGRLFEVEGRLSRHEYIDGDYQDLFVLALDRDRWREQEHRMTWSSPRLTI